MSERKPFLLRVPKELLDELRGWAAQEMRSLNGQIEIAPRAEGGTLVKLRFRKPEQKPTLELVHAV